MIGAFIGDLAAWTWENNHDMFYSHLFTDQTKKSIYSDVLHHTATTLIKSPTMGREEFLQGHETFIGKSDALGNATIDLLRSIAIGWIYDGEDIPEAINRYCLLEEKEEHYASHFMALLIYKLRTGATKNDAAQVEHCGTFRAFTKQKQWKSGNGPLSYLVRAWISFYDAYDFGSAMHNAVKNPGNRTINCMLAAALAGAMYGSGCYYVKKKYGESRDLEPLMFVDNSIYYLTHKKRTFFAKNNARANAERHQWKGRPCPLHNKVITPELKRRVTKGFGTDWENRFGFYLDDGWIYVYRSFVILARFQFRELADGTYRITNYQKSDEGNDYDMDDHAIGWAMYSAEHNWGMISNE